MMTSRSEYRLILRQDNAPERLTELGHEIGLISDERYGNYLEMKRIADEETKRIRKTSVRPSPEFNAMLESKGTSAIDQPTRIAELLKRPQLKYKDIIPFDESAPDIRPDLAEKIEVSIKYEGYITTQLAKIKEMKRLENKMLPADIDYMKIEGLRLEAREKLNEHRPMNIGQAGRISGVNPADITVLLIWLAANKENGKDEDDEH